MQKKKKRTKAKKEFQCKFCKREFVYETALLSHMCEKKRRWYAQDTRPARLGFMAWVEFMNSASISKQYLYEDFIKSRLYNDFVKFGSYLVDLNPIEPQDFVSHLIKHNVKLKDWVKDYPYTTYVRNKLVKETPDAALTRSLHVAAEWALDKNTSIECFFEEINTNTALHWIAQGKISPWFIMASSKSDKLLSRFNGEQAVLLSKYIDKVIWKVKIKKFREEFDNIKEILKEHNL